LRHARHRAPRCRCDFAAGLSPHTRRGPDLQISLFAGSSFRGFYLWTVPSEDPLLTDPVIAVPVLPEVLPPRKRRGPVALFVRRYPNIAIGGFLGSVIVGIAIFAPLLRAIDPTALAPIQRTQPPSATFWFGTDMLGRDVYSRVLYGTRISLTVGLSVALLASMIGLAIG